MFEPLTCLLDGCSWLETQLSKDRVHRLAVVDTRFELLAGLRGGVDEWPLVRHLHVGSTFCTLASEPNRFVGFCKRSSRVVVVRIDLFDDTDGFSTEFGQTAADGVVFGTNLQLDFVHTRSSPASGKNAVDVGRARNVIVKGATAVVANMSDESDEVDETDAPAEDEQVTDDAADAEVDETEEETTADAAEDEETADEDGLQDGDFVRIAYTARTVDDETLVDTTDEEVAEEEGVADQGTFEPRVIVLGQGHLFAAVEDDIIGKDVGASGSVVIEAAEAFGEYDDENVRTVSADKIDEDDRYPGARINIDGQQGVLETIIGGRARVDFNHPLAGEDIEYDYEVVEQVEGDLEQARGLLNMFLDVDLEMWVETDEVEETRVEEPDEDDEDAEPETVTETVEKRSLYVEATPQLTMNQQWMFEKQQIAQQLIDLTEIDRIVIQEILDGMGGMGMPGMMGMGGGAGAEDADIEELLEEADIDADEIVDEIEE